MKAMENRKVELAEEQRNHSRGRNSKSHLLRRLTLTTTICYNNDATQFTKCPGSYKFTKKKKRLITLCTWMISRYLQKMKMNCFHFQEGKEKQ